MFERLKRYFLAEKESDREGSGKGIQHDLRVATCARFLEMAAADGEFSDAERDCILPHDLEYSLIDSL